MERLRHLKRFVPAFLFVVFSIFYCFEVKETVVDYNRTNKVINEDAFGYYLILPAFFKYHDPNFEFLDTVVRHQEAYKNYIPPVVNQLDNGEKVCKYYCGPALLEAPFYLIAQLFSNDEFDNTHHTFILISSIFYVLIGSLLLYMLLMKIGQTPLVSIALVSFGIFGTNLFVYTSYDAAYSHAFSYFAFSAFAFCVYQIKSNVSAKYYILSGLIFGLITIIRPLNGIVILIVPIIWGKSFFTLLKHKNIVLTIVASCFFPMVQSLLWFWQTGQLYVYPYGKETLDLSHPQLFEFIFSYNCGWAVYTPGIVLVLLTSIALLIFQKQFTKATLSIIIGIVTLYLMSCWYYLHYGCTAGCRPITEYYSLIVLLAGYSTKTILNSSKIRWVVVSILMLLTYYNRIVVYQFFNNIINWCDMDKKRFEMVYLKTDKVYNYSTSPFWDFSRFDSVQYHSEIDLDCDLALNSSLNVPIGYINVGDSSMLFDLYFKATNVNKDAYLDILVTDDGKYVEQQTLLLCRKVESLVPTSFKFQFLIHQTLSDSSKIDIQLKSTGSRVPCIVAIEKLRIKKIRYR